MRVALLITVFALFLMSCYKRADYSKDICVNDCTIVSGTLLTAGSQPVAGVTLRLTYGNNHYLSVSDNRNFGEAATDENGHFQFKFYMPKDLLGKANAGKFSVDIDTKTVDYNKYIYSSMPNMTLFDVFNKRDTIINFSFYLPEKTFIKVSLENYHPVAAGDKISATGYAPYGLMVDNNGFQNPLNRYLPFAGITLSDTTKSSVVTDSFIMAKEAMNMIQITRMKNGIETIESDTFFVPDNNNIELHYSY